MAKTENLPPKERDVFLTAPQAAEILNVSTATLKKIIWEGKVRVFKTPGGHYRICKKDLLSSLISE